MSTLKIEKQTQAPYFGCFFRASTCLWWPEDSQEPQPTCPRSTCSFSNKKPYSKSYLSQEFPTAEPSPCPGAGGKEVESGEFQSHLWIAPCSLQTRRSTETSCLSLTCNETKLQLKWAESSISLHCYSSTFTILQDLNQFVSENHLLIHLTGEHQNQHINSLQNQTMPQKQVQ